MINSHLHRKFYSLTGTGKTLISAFDFARFWQQKPDATFLFVAHREEILIQARNAYRGVLRDSHFGELWVGNYQPTQYQQLFVSVQTLNNQLEKLNLSSDFYDFIVVDEVHHVIAQSYRKFLQHFQPTILLGLTATPERHDGGDILADFDHVIAAEIRLPEAVNQRHLCPFQYFAIDDDTDLRSIRWSNGRYDITQLTNLYTHNQARVNKIVNSLRDIVTDLSTMRALAFCVGHDHANFMVQQFLLKGIKADILTSDNTHDRVQKQQAIRSGAINVLCVVDIFNEGVDIPEIDTLLFLRPTESLTIFLQQLGRGLRLSDNKQCCTVLDFVGNARPEYNFSNKFRALIGRSHRAIEDEIRQGFPNAPLGCSIELTKQSQDLVLSNIRAAILTAKRLRNAVQQFSQNYTEPLTLANFLRLHSTVNIHQLYKELGWVALLQEANSLPYYQTQPALLQAAEQLPLTKYTAPSTELITRFSKAIRNRILGCDDYHYLHFLQNLCQQRFQLTDETDRRAVMCHYDFWQKTGDSFGFATLRESLTALYHPMLCSELYEVVTWQMQQIKHQQMKMANLTEVPLSLHARYAREQILAAFGASTFDKQVSLREGVFVIKTNNIELLFVTLNKNPKVFSPNTMYHDYAINEWRFHWQSQNSARPERGRGLDYIQHKSLGKRLFLFVREQSDDEYGRTLGFVNFGEVDYISHTGSQPMNIIWQLHEAMPDFMWHHTAKLAVG